MSKLIVNQENITSILRDIYWLGPIAEGEGGHRDIDNDGNGYPGTGMRRPDGSLYGMPASWRRTLLTYMQTAGLIVLDEHDEYSITLKGQKRLLTTDFCECCGTLRNCFKYNSSYSHPHYTMKNVTIVFACGCEQKKHSPTIYSPFIRSSFNVGALIPIKPSLHCYDIIYTDQGGESDIDGFAFADSKVKTRNIQIPRYILQHTTRLKHTSEFGDATEGILGTCECGRSLRAFCAYIKDTETGREFVLGSECVKKITGYSLGQIRAATAHYNAELEELDEEIRITAIVKEFIEANKDIIDHIEFKIAEEQIIYDKRCEEWNAVQDNEKPHPIYRGEFWESLANQIQAYGSLSRKQIDVVRNDMTRNRKVELKVGEWIIVSGNITKYFPMECGYGRDYAAKIYMRTDDNVDIMFRLGAESQLCEQLGSVKMYEVKGDVFVEGVPDRIDNLRGKIKWIDPAGGKARLVNCKIVNGVK